MSCVDSTPITAIGITTLPRNPGTTLPLPHSRSPPALRCYGQHVCPRHLEHCCSALSAGSCCHFSGLELNGDREGSCLLRVAADESAANACAGWQASGSGADFARA